MDKGSGGVTDASWSCFSIKSSIVISLPKASVNTSAIAKLTLYEPYHLPAKPPYHMPPEPKEDGDEGEGTGSYDL